MGGSRDAVCDRNKEAARDDRPTNKAIELVAAGVDGKQQQQQWADDAVSLDNQRGLEP